MDGQYVPAICTETFLYATETSTNKIDLDTLVKLPETLKQMLSEMTSIKKQVASLESAATAARQSAGAASASASGDASFSAAPLKK